MSASAPARGRVDTAVWLMDGGHRRAVGDADVTAAWGLDLATAESWPGAFLLGLPEGASLPRERFVAQDEHGLFVVDAMSDTATGDDPSSSSGDAATGEAESSAGEGSESALASGGSVPAEGQARDDGGCGCRSPGSHGVAMPLLVVLACVGRSRPRSRPR